MIMIMPTLLHAPIHIVQYIGYANTACRLRILAGVLIEPHVSDTISLVTRLMAHMTLKGPSVPPRTVGAKYVGDEYRMGQHRLIQFDQKCVERVNSACTHAGSVYPQRSSPWILLSTRAHTRVMGIGDQ